MTRIALIGEYDPAYHNHVATEESIRHSAARLGVTVESEWVSSVDVSTDKLREFSAVWVVPGSPYKDFEKTLASIRYARENCVPYLGTCGGFQHLIVEYARNVLGVTSADHGEYDPDAATQFVTRLECSLVGQSMLLTFSESSIVARCHDSLEATEQYYCNFGVNPEFVEQLKSGPLKVVGSDAEGEIRVVELPNHPFFVGTLYVPQARSTAESPHPLVTEFVRVAVNGT